VIDEPKKANGPGAPFGCYQGRPTIRLAEGKSQLTLSEQSNAGLVIARQKFVFLRHRRH
jgi:hypothetical protein